MKTEMYFEEIRRCDWIRWNWICINEFGEERAKYIRGCERDANEAEEAGRNFDIYAGVWKATQAQDE